jgi:hypothetical protein
MTPVEHEKLKGMLFEQMDVTIGPVPGPDRTLLYGYDTDRRTWHVYQRHGELHRLIYIDGNPETSPPEGYISAPRLKVDIIVPNKRLYPEGCDFEFCKKLRKLNVHMTFLSYGQMTPKPDSPFIARIM